MIQSMTGFGQAEIQFENKNYVLNEVVVKEHDLTGFDRSSGDNGFTIYTTLLYLLDLLQLLDLYIYWI